MKMGTFLIVAAIANGVFSVVEIILAIRAKTVENEMRWRLRSLHSLVHMVFFVLLLHMTK